MKIIKRIHYNWHQAGSIESRDGAGENYSWHEVGIDGVVEIEESIPCNGNQVWNYLVKYEDGREYRIFNPNYVQYNINHDNN